MYNAPPVVYPVGRFVWGSWLMGGLALLGFVSLAFWQVLVLPGWPQSLVAWLVWSASVAGAVGYWPQERSPQGSLIWSGEDWLWRDEGGAERPVRVRVLLDAGRLMGLVYEVRDAINATRKPARFAVLHQTTIPSSWHGFRCAVYSRPMDDSVPVHQHESHLEI